MKISPLKNTSNVSIVKRIKNMFSNCRLKLKTLTKDVFENRNKYIVFDGKKIRERDLPNCVTGPSDIEGVTWSKIKFYPEDEAVMAKMKTAREQIEYTKKLKKEGRYTIVKMTENNKQ